MEKLLGAFDFDYTIIKENSDFLVRDLLSPEVLKARLKHFNTTQGWTDYMEEIFKILFEEGFAEEKIRDTITAIPAVPNFIELFKRLKQINCEIIIISDSNTYFIEEWLKWNGIRDTVDVVYSNPANFSEGKLLIKKYHEQDWCQLSTRNLCKGYILETHIKKKLAEGLIYKRIFYVGDGQNDVCPSLKLQANNLIFPRIGFSLHKELQLLGSTVKADVIPWEHTNEILSVVENL